MTAKKKGSRTQTLRESKSDLKKALARRRKLEDELLALQSEIPALERIIAALEGNQYPEPAPVVTRVQYVNSETGATSDPSPVAPPAVLDRAKKATEAFGGAGSIPARSGPAVRELTEDELLSDEIPSTPLIEE